MTQKEVRKLLGNPDDVWPPNDPIEYVTQGDEVWCYGTTGHHTLPTLGRVRFAPDFRDGKTRVTNFPDGYEGTPPSPDLIPEAELRHWMSRLPWKTNPQRADYRSSPEVLTELANELRPLGADRAAAVLEEFSRVTFESDPFDDHLFWLSRTLFVPSRSLGSVSSGASGLNAGQPDDLRYMPNYTLAILDGFPMPLSHPVSGGTGLGPMPYYVYARAQHSLWEIRKSPLRPPDDPFTLDRSAAPQELVGNRADTDPKQFREHVREQILTAVQYVLDAEDEPWRTQYDAAFTKAHQKFLGRGGHWDALQQRYVRTDGTARSREWTEYPQEQYRFRGIPGVKLEVSYNRANPHWVNFGAEKDEFGSKPVSNVVLEIIDQRSGKILGALAFSLNEQKISDAEISSFLRESPHSPQKDSSVGGIGLDIASGQGFFFRVRQGAHTYMSPLCRT